MLAAIETLVRAFIEGLKKWLEAAALALLVGWIRPTGVSKA